MPAARSSACRPLVAPSSYGWYTDKPSHRQEYDAAGAVDYAVAAFPPSDARATLMTRQTPGTGINKRVSAAVARRTLQRGALLAAVLAGTV